MSNSNTSSDEPREIEADQPPPLPPRYPASAVPLRPAPGLQSARYMPSGVDGWCWGGFLLNWVWALRFRVWWGLLALVPVLGFGVMIALGLKGRQLAWRNRAWASVEDFNRSQRRWSMWGAAVGVIGMLLFAGAYLQERHAESPMLRESWPVPEAPRPTLESIPQPKPSTDLRPAAGQVEQGEVGDDRPARIDTVGGPLEMRRLPSQDDVVFFNGKQLFFGMDAPWQRLVRKFRLSDGTDAVLLVSSGGRGNSCDTLFFFLLIDSAGNQRFTPEFGSCAPEATFELEEATITLTMPRMGGVTRASLINGRVVQDGEYKALQDSDDPSK